MTPSPLNPAPAKPAVMPLVALILGVLSFCLAPVLVGLLLFPVAVVLAIVSLVKASDPAYAARKTLAIITLVICGTYVPVVGVLAAIAIPNFLKFQARSKQSECKVNLKVAFTGQRSYFLEKDQYAQRAEEIGFEPSPNRYTYLLPGEVLPAGQLSQTPQERLLRGIPAELRESVGISGTCPDCTVTMACAGNVDNDDTIDVWSVSSEPRVFKGEQVPAGVPYNEVNDVSE